MIRYVNQGEAVLVKFQGKAGVYIREARVEQAVTPIADALAGLLDEDTLQVLLLDMDTLRAEDITTEAATVFLADWAGNPDEDDAPEFVKSSDVFEDWCEQYHIENGFSARKEHGTVYATGGSIVG